MWCWEWKEVRWKSCKKHRKALTEAGSSGESLKRTFASKCLQWRESNKKQRIHNCWIPITQLVLPASDQSQSLLQVKVKVSYMFMHRVLTWIGCQHCPTTALFDNDATVIFLIDFSDNFCVKRSVFDVISWLHISHGFMIAQPLFFACSSKQWHNSNLFSHLFCCLMILPVIINRGLPGGAIWNLSLGTSYNIFFIAPTPVDALE